MSDFVAIPKKSGLDWESREGEGEGASLDSRSRGNDGSVEIATPRFPSGLAMTAVRNEDQE